VQQQVRGLVGEGGEFDVRGLSLTAGDAATVGVAVEAACECLVLELDVVTDEEGFQRLGVAVGVRGIDGGAAMFAAATVPSSGSTWAMSKT